jgi:hypothetical protein
MNPVLIEKRFLVYRSGMPYRKVSLDDLVDGWYHHELLGSERVLDEETGRQFPVCAAGMILEFLTGEGEFPEDTAILLTSYYRKIATMRQAMEMEEVAA